MAETKVVKARIGELDSTNIEAEAILISDLQDFAPSDGGSLNLDVGAGRIRNDNTVTDKNAQVVALSDDTTNFVEIDNVGAASANTTAFTAGSIAIATVVTASGSISSVADKRAWVSIGGGGGELTTFVGGFTRDNALANGTQAVTGVGFVPKAVIFHAAINTVAPNFSVGLDNGTGARSWRAYDAITADAWGGNFTESVHMQLTSTITNECHITSLDSDGFTVTWSKAGAPTGTITVNFMALK